MRYRCEQYHVCFLYRLFLYPAQRFRSTIELSSNATEQFRINYYSSCGGSTINKTSKCSSLAVDDEVDFEVEITLTECPKNSYEWKQTIEISSMGIDNITIIDVEMLCECPCQRDLKVAKSPECNMNGYLICGVCECDDTHTGKSCDTAM